MSAQAARSVWMARLGRVGLGARGVLYLLLAYLAVRVAIGQPESGTTDRQGALRTVVRQPFGHLLMAGLAVGFGAYAVWQVAIGALGGAARAGSGKNATRLIALGNGVVYGLFCVSTVALAAGSSGAAGGNAAEVELTATVMEHSLGRTLVGLAGTAFIVTGAVLVRRTLAGQRDVKLQPISRSMLRRIEILATVGLTARALIIAAAGTLLLQAAVTFDPSRAKGLDGVLHSFAHTPVGPWLLVPIAGGLMAFGAYSLAAARFGEL